MINSASPQLDSPNLKIVSLEPNQWVGRIERTSGLPSPKKLAIGGATRELSFTHTGVSLYAHYHELISLINISESWLN